VEKRKKEKTPKNETLARLSEESLRVERKKKKFSCGVKEPANPWKPLSTEIGKENYRKRKKNLK